MDDASARLILAVQWQDLEQAKMTTKENGADSETLTDEELALQLQQQEYEQAAFRMSDHRIARSIHRAVIDDGANVVILAGEENQASIDHDLASRLHRQLNPRATEPTTPAPALHNLAVDHDNLPRYSSLNDADDGEDGISSRMDMNEENTPESSVWMPTEYHETHQYRCVACQDIRETVKLPCEHSYCGECICRLFSDAMVDETLFPPRCCRQHIPVSLVRHLLGFNLAAEFEQKAIEFGTPNRTYCSNAICGAFIEPSNIHGSIGTCPRLDCGTQTCVLCKRASHDGDYTHQDPFEDTLRLAQEQGWQRCEHCQTMVELEIGCNHIT